MLSPNYLINRVGDITTMYSDLHASTLEAIARHIADTLRATGKPNIIPSVAFQIERLNHTGMLRDEMVNRIAALTRISRKEVRQMFVDAAIKTREYDDRIYLAAGITPIPVMQSPAMLQILESGISKTLGSVERLTGTFALNAENRFNELLNIGYNKAVSGAFTYSEAISDTVDDLVREGVKTFYYASGREISVEAAVRMNILTGANQTAGHISHQTAIELEANLVRTTAHLGARNAGDGFRNHESWQGKIFSLNGKTDKYEDFYAACGYGDVQGIYGANCKHSHGPYFEGVSPETYTDEMLDEFANATVTHTDWNTGEEATISYYDGTQKLRYLEGMVREWDRRYKSKVAAGIDANADKARLKLWRSRIRRFTDETGFRRDYKREATAT